MQRLKDKYGRGSAVANGAEFVDLEPGDTFSGLEAKLRLVQTVIYENRMLGLRASIASRRNANELSKHMAPGEAEEAHKFAAKNVGVLFSRGGLGIRHFDKKAIRDDSPKPVMLRVFSAFVFADERMIATITLRQEKDGNKLYAIEALEINKDADSERTPRGGTAPLQNLASQLANRIAYYVGDVNRTQPSFVASEELFSVERAVSGILKMNGGRVMTTTDISVIILIGQEKIHLKRCVEKLKPLEPKCIWLVESQPDDGGVAIAKETAENLGLTLKTVYNKWPGLYAKQLNWAIDNLPIESTWILRLDADEYLYPETCEEVRHLVTAGGLPPDVTSLSLSLSRVFCGRKIRFGGTAHIPMVRFFKYGIGRCQDRAMDEHIVTSHGRDYRLKGEFADDNLNSMDWWREKHRGYAKREARDALAGEKFKTSKGLYYRFPPYLRAFIYFSIRYFLLLGFLDGYAGWMWHFWQGLWYRWIVDREIGRLKKDK